MTSPETQPTNKWRVIVYHGETTLRGELAWKRVYDVRGPAKTIQGALRAVATKAESDKGAVLPEPTPVRKQRRTRKPKHTAETVKPTAKYPEITVSLHGLDSNPSGIIGRTRRTLRKREVPTDEILEFSTAAKAKFNGLAKVDRDEAIAFVKKWVTIK